MECPNFQKHTHKCWRWMNPTLPHGFHFGGWSPTMSQKFGTTFGITKLVQIRPSLECWKGLKNLTSQVGLHSPFQDLKHKLWPKKWEKNQIVNLTPNHQNIQQRDQMTSMEFTIWCRKVLFKGYSFSCIFFKIRVVI